MDQTDKTPACLIVDSDAVEFAEEIARKADFPLAVSPCTSAGQALKLYSGQTILFGNPDMIAEILPKLPAVHWVQSCWAGVTPLIDIERRDYVLTGVKGVFGPQMSEYVMAYLLAHELKVLERVKYQSRRDWVETPSGGLQGKHLGIMGTGSIAQEIARKAKAFHIEVSGLSQSGAPSPGFDQVLPVSRLHEFLEPCDYLVATLPQTAGTDNLLDGAALAKLPAHAYFINVGRSNVVDDDALIESLRNKELAGATLDVFDQEPLAPDSPLWNAPGLSITAHIAAVSYPSLIVPIFIENYRRFSNQQALKYVVDFDKGY